MNPAKIAPAVNSAGYPSRHATTPSTAGTTGAIA
jgi:hypothetical protein